MNERKMLLLQVVQSDVMLEFVSREVEKLVVDMRNHVKNGQHMDAYADEKLIQYLENLLSRLKTFASK